MLVIATPGAARSTLEPKFEKLTCVLETGTDGAPCANDQFVRNVAWGATSEGRSWGIFLRCGQGMLIAHNTIVDLDSFALSVDDDNSSFAS